MIEQLDELYREVILDHFKNPSHSGDLPGAHIKAEGTNPLCGDEVTFYLTIDDGRVAQARFQVDLGDLEALAGVRKFPVRVKCAALSWNVVEQGLQDYRAGHRS
ncbi:MAG: iron-sulfur cluster assembly scaffold protein [Candidatus Omnitrophica bacterium]|nr:iron-sulfur cluster assembly scaffold protein [Candidatus Omnitrophota bacterium]